jgi:hypothetical protein
MTRTLAVAVFLCCMFVAGVLAGVHMTSTSEPWCPTEDSCAIDYHDGGWHITEVTP